MFLKLEGRPCLVVGAGTVAEGKIGSLLLAGATVRVVAPQADVAVQEWARTGVMRWESREFCLLDLDGVFLVIAATSSNEVNGSVFREAQRRNVLCNVVDDPEHCDFYYPAVVRRGQLQIGISTAGESPAREQKHSHKFLPQLESTMSANVVEARVQASAKSIRCLFNMHCWVCKWFV